MTAQPPPLTTVMGTLLLVSAAQSLVNYFIKRFCIPFFPNPNRNDVPLDISEL